MRKFFIVFIFYTINILYLSAQDYCKTPSSTDTNNEQKLVKEHKEWLVEVYNTTQGGKMYSGKSASTSCSINTSNGLRVYI